VGSGVHEEVSMYVIAGFQSRIHAHGGALAVVDAARERGGTVAGAAFARLDAERGIHVDPVPGFGMPEHVLQVLDGFVCDVPGEAQIHMGETGLVLALDDDADLELDTLVTSAHLGGRGALWVSTANGGGSKTAAVGPGSAEETESDDLDRGSGG
jgi:hypothetical protein